MQDRESVDSPAAWVGGEKGKGSDAARGRPLTTMVQYFVGRECLGARIGHSGGKGCRGDTAAGCASPPPYQKWCGPA